MKEFYEGLYFNLRAYVVTLQKWTTQTNLYTAAVKQADWRR